MSFFLEIAAFPPMGWVLVLLVATCGVMLRSWRYLRGTTLTSPWLWMQGSMGLIGGTHLLVAVARVQWIGTPNGSPLNWEPAVLFASAASSFCPLVSLLGAKRPQDRGWHFVVLSLWAILVLPAAESLVLRHGQMPDVEGARSWFMLILIGLGIINAIPTRFWFPAILYGCGQLLMLADSLPVSRQFVESSPTISGFSCCALACMTATLLASRRDQVTDSLDAVWRDFRDAFGLLWGLRVKQQINLAARSSCWPVTLHWQGFVDGRGNPLDSHSLPDETRESLQQVIQNLLRRFVSPGWIAARMGNGID